MGMDFSNLPNNSNAAKSKAQPLAIQPQPTETKKVVKGTVVKKKNEIRKFTDVFVAEDAGSVWDYLLHEMIIPTTKNLVVDLGQSFIERMILGGTSRGGRATTFRGRDDYNDYSKYSRTEPRYASPGRSVTRFDYEDIVYKSINDANAVLDTMENILRRYGVVRVSDLYDLVGDTVPHTAHHYGWTSLSRARVVPCRNGYTIEFPKHAEVD